MTQRRYRGYMRWIVRGGRGRVIAMALAIALTALASTIAPVPLATAHGDGLEIFRGREGPYDVVVEVQPATAVVGTVHFGIGVLETASLAPIDDLRVLLVAINEESEPVYQSPAIAVPETPGIYDANILFRSPGIWTLSIEITNEQLGDASVEVPFAVEQPRRGSGLAGPLVLAGVVIVIAGGSTYVWYSARRQRSSRVSRRRRR